MACQNPKARQRQTEILEGFTQIHKDSKINGSVYAYPWWSSANVRGVVGPYNSTLAGLMLYGLIQSSREMCTYSIEDFGH